MSQGLREVHRADLAAELERQLLGRFQQMLAERAPGHCMRVSDLDDDLMRRVAVRLRQDSPGSEVHVLSGEAAGDASGIAITSTKLIELRNPAADGTLRPPLLVFVPNELRTSSEDSFGVATFEDVQLGDVYAAFNRRLLEETPVSLRGSVQAILQRLADRHWRWADSVAITRFLLTIKLNDFDAEVVGAALFELGLVPDFKLLVEPARAPHRVIANAECAARLAAGDRSERLRVLDLGLRNRAFRAELANFLAEQGLENPRAWTRKIVVERANWRFSFDKWEFEDEASAPDQVFIEVVATGLPRVEEDSTDERLQGLIGQQILPVGKEGLSKFNVSFRVDPHPSKVSGLAKFRLEIVSVEAGPTGVVKSVAAWSSRSDQKTVLFSKLNHVDWEEGWHFVRVQAVTSDDDLLTLVDRNGEPLPWTDDSRPGQTQAPNESGLFYVLVDGAIDVEPVQRAVPRYPSLLHALRDLQFSAVLDGHVGEQVKPTEVAWSKRSPAGARGGQELIEVKFGSSGAVAIPVSHTLRVLEDKMLAAAGQLSVWRLSIDRGVAGEPIAEPIPWPASLSCERFLQARGRLFTAIRQGDQRLVSQGANFGELHALAVDYGQEYQSLLQALLRRMEATSGGEQHGARLALQALLNLDVVFVTLTNYRGQRQEAALLGPLHPLRCLWLAGWAALGARWVHQAITCRREFVSAARDVLLERLVPAHQPPYLSVGHGRVFAAVDSIHPLWTLYAASLEPDPRGLIGNVCSALALPEPDIGGLTVTGKYLAGRVQRYLVQHPYLRTLAINAFNPGRAGVLADMLLELQGHEDLQFLHYDVRLFVPDADEPGVGESLLALLSSEGTVTARRADAFSTPARDHLNPKLRVAICPTEAFRAASQDYAAHLSMLFDVFPAEEVSAGTIGDESAIAPMHGLLQDFAVDYVDDGQTVAWTRQPRHGPAAPLPGTETITDLLSTLPGVFSAATAAVATGQAGLAARPQVTLALDNEDRALIHQVHEVSDWAFTVDRNIGIEYFDHGGRCDRPEYLIEHTPRLENGLGHQLLITSRSLIEIEAMMRSVLEKFQLQAEGTRAAAILDNLRCLSGRLALKLISSPTQRTEALGLALARMYLADQGIFANQVVVPLDAHLELYREPRRQARELHDEISLQRTDLALFDLNAETRTITCNLVEVKCYTQTGGLSGYAQLKETVASQLEQSEQVLRQHFDPQLYTPDRLDRSFKVAEFTKLLEFYLDRSERFALLDSDAADEARFLLRTLAAGYKMAFTRSGLIFDFEKNGADAPDVESGVEFHRIGADMIRALIDAAGRRPIFAAAASEAPAGPPTPEASTSVLKKAAAFLPKPRDRSVARQQVTLLSEDAEQIAEPSLPRQDQPPPSEPSWELAVERKTVAAGSDVASASVAAEDFAGPLASAEAQARSAASHPIPEAGPQTTKPVAYDVILGCTDESPQYGLLGEVAGRRIALDLNQTQTISLFGVQDGGKSYTLGTIAEMATMPINNINRLPSPLATVIFHFSPTQDYHPEFTAMSRANTDPLAVDSLRRRFEAAPQAVDDVVLLVPADKVEQRRAEYAELSVWPLSFASSDLKIGHWQFLMGAVGSQAVYIRQLKALIRSLRDDLTLTNLHSAVDQSSLPNHLKDLARMRLGLAAQYIDDTSELSKLLRPGRLVIVDLRDEFIEKDEALGLFVVLMQLFADAKHKDRRFNKLIVFDEAHKYIDSPDLVSGLVDVVRQMRHKGTSVMVASQDPPSVPVSLIELSTQIILHRFNSPAWLKHLQKANAALSDLTPEKMASLGQGEAYTWSSKASDDAFCKGAVKVKCRPRVTQHGGGTRTAVE